MSEKISKQILLLLLMLMSNSVIYSQITISGKVYVDSIDSELPGASIVEMYKTTNGTVTNIDGKFTLIVADTSLVRFSFVGCKDTIIPARQLINAAVILKSIELSELFIDYHYDRTLTVGYYGDINYLPFGIRLSTFQPNFLMFIGSLYYKTNFQSDYSFEISLTKVDLIRNNNYVLNVSGEYRDKKLNFSKLNYEAKDFQVSFGNSIGNIISFAPGLIYREEKIAEFENNFGYYLAIYKGFSRIGNFISCSYTYFGDYSEYHLAIYQKLSVNNWKLSRFQVGLAYNHYREYDELNISFRYKLSY